MSDLIYDFMVPEMNKSFGITGQLINTAYVGVRIGSYIPYLTNIFNSPSASVKELEKSLKQLLNQLNTQSLDADQSLLLLNEVKEHIQLIISNPKESGLKQCSFFQSFDSYIEPLTTLYREIEKYSFSCLPPTHLVPQVEKAIHLIESEVNGQTGLLKYFCQKTYNLVTKEWFSQNVPSLTHHSEPSMFVKLLHAIKLAQGQKDASIPLAVRRQLEEIERTYPQLHGIKGLIEDKKDARRFNQNIEIDLERFIDARSKNLPLFSKVFNFYCVKHTLFYDDPIPLGISLKILELTVQIEHFNQVLETFSKEPPLEKVYKTLRFLDFVKGHSDALQIDLFASNLCKNLDMDLTLILDSYSEELNENEKRAIEQINALIYQQDFFLTEKEWDHVLTQLKKLFDEGSFLTILGKSTDLHSPISQVQKLKSSAATRILKTKQATSNSQFEKDFSAIEQEARLLAHHISMRSTFEFFSNRYQIDSQTSEVLFARILKEVELHPYNGSQKQLEKREAIFREKIDQMINEHSLFNLKLLQWIVFKYISYFTNNLSQLLIDHEKAALLQLPKPSSKSYTTLIECTNQGVLSLLFAQNAWQQNPFQREGIGTKEDTIFAFVKNKDISKESVQKMTDQILDTFIVPSVFSNHASNKVTFVFNRVIQFFVKKIIHLMIMKPDQLVSDTLEKIQDTLYGVNYVHPYLDQFLLEQIEALEQTINTPVDTLNQTASFAKGHRESVVASELTHNLLALLRKKGAPALTDETASFLGKFNDQIKKLIDEQVIKDMLNELIISTNKEFMQKETLSALTLNILKNANASLKEGKMAFLEQFEQKHGLDASEDLEARLEIYESALQQEQYETEQKLYKAIERVLHRMVEKELNAKISALKDSKELQDTLSEYTGWINQHFNPKMTDIKKGASYVHQMETVCEQLLLSFENNNDTTPLIEKMENMHNQLFIQWEEHLERLEKMHTLAPSKLNLEIKELYQITSQLIAPLQKVHKCLMKKDYKQLIKKIRLLKNEAKHCQHNLMQLHIVQKKEPPSFSAQIVDKIVDKVVEQGGTTKVTDYLVSHVFMPLAKEAIATCKAPSTFTAFVERGLFLRYLSQQVSCRA